MKCVCGYEQADPFENYKRKIPFGDFVAKLDAYEGLYVCPQCGTVKFEEVEEAAHVRNN